MRELPPGGPVLLFDFDSTLVTVEALDELFEEALREAGLHGPEAVARFRAITDAGMGGSLPHEASLAARLALFPGGGPTRTQVRRTAERVAEALTPSILRNRDFFRRYRARIRILSGGFTDLIGPAASRLEIPGHQVSAHAFRGGAEGPLDLDPSTPMARAGKVGTVRTLLDAGAIPRHRPLWIVGDGATDLELRTSRLAHVFVAFTENVVRDSVVEAADHVVDSMEALLDLLADPSTPMRSFHD